MLAVAPNGHTAASEEPEDIDWDLETSLVMAAIARHRPQPLVHHIPKLSLHRRNQRHHIRAGMASVLGLGVLAANATGKDDGEGVSEGFLSGIGSQPFVAPPADTLQASWDRFQQRHQHRSHFQR